MKASPEIQRVVSPLQGRMVEVGGMMMWVNEVGTKVEVGGKIIEIDAIDDDVPQVGAAGVLGATGF